MKAVPIFIDTEYDTWNGPSGTGKGFRNISGCCVKVFICGCPLYTGKGEIGCL